MRYRLDPDMPAQSLRLHMGELTAQEVRTARAAIKWANASMLREIEETKWEGWCAVCGGDVNTPDKEAI